jgi:hypothetical protein
MTRKPENYPVETQVGSLHLILRLNIPGAQGDM